MGGATEGTAVALFSGGAVRMSNTFVSCNLRSHIRATAGDVKKYLPFRLCSIQYEMYLLSVSPKLLTRGRT